ncbi:LysR family transcriptional regulator [Sinomonas sp. ASV486]|uniref:LysR family transcriptional regulator n=1 Tax=Sinomonas sp. ASV486 TaxID=3051170 RepID=UPI0027DCB1EB|nr:LysR family transcriptional regulator [Sinomonas sp. ASV486]MDQ4490676.1 LysR family transcriptional regulator [Sinomonas sp. ASV486]
MVDFKGLPSPDDLLILLTVARLGRFTAVAEALETTHTTVSRRVAALDRRLGGRTLARTPHGWELTELGRRAVAAAEGIESSLGDLSASMANKDESLTGHVRVGASDAFGALIVAPALARLQEEHRLLRVELVTATRRLSRNRSGFDLEIVPGTAEAPRVQAVVVTDHVRRLYAGRGYVRRRGMPHSLEELTGHAFVGYAESALQVAELAYGRQSITDEPAAFQATSIFPQAEAVRANAGIGLLPEYVVRGHSDFVPVLHHEFERHVRFWAAARSESMRSPAVRAVVSYLLEEAQRRRHQLLPPPRIWDEEEA